jgi:hypothetical protein
MRRTPNSSNLASMQLQVLQKSWSSVRHRLNRFQLGDWRPVSSRGDDGRLSPCAFLTSSESFVLASNIVAVVVMDPPHGC